MKKILIHKPMTCPECGHIGRPLLLLNGTNNNTKHQCQDCFNVFILIYNKHHKLIDYLIEDDNDDTDYLQ